MLMNVDSSTASIQMRLRQEPLQPARPLFANENFKAYLQLCNAVLGKVDKYAIKIDSIRNDKSRTLQGQQAQYAAALAPQVLKEVGPVVIAPLDDVNAAMQRLRRLMFDPIMNRPKGDPMVTFLREQELRSRIPKGEANKEYLAALGADDLETARAILDASGRPLITDEIKRRGEEDYAKRTNPAAWAQLQSLDYFKDHLKSLVEQVRIWVLALGATPESVQSVLGD
jgi:hypothetical protein